MTEPERLLDLFLAVENEAAAFYEALARRFADHEDLGALWTDLAADERQHARWIQEIRALAGPRWTPKTGQSWTPENRPVR